MAKKVLIVVGTRPNFIKISQFDNEFARHNGAFEYRLLHTGQHYDDNMSAVFFEQLNIRKPDYHLAVQESKPARQIAEIILKLEEVLTDWQPDIVLVPGDVNSTMAAAITCNKCGIKVGHIESGLRSFDREMPEEHNRIITDDIADVHFVTEQSGLDHLREEGKDEKGIVFVGNTMIDTLVSNEEGIMASDVMERLGVEEGRYVLMTMHRPSNVDVPEQLEKLLDIIDGLGEQYKVVFPIHPRTRANIKKLGYEERVRSNENLLFTDALDYYSFQKLIAGSKMVITDSGGIQEETTFRQVPCITLRENTERPVTIELGTNVLMSLDTAAVMKKAGEVAAGTFKKGTVPPKWDGLATRRIVDYLKETL